MASDEVNYTDDDEELEEWQKFLDDSDDEPEEEIVPMKVESNHSVAALPDHVGSGPPTSQITFMETEHGRMRRRQRGIDKKDLQAAKKHGKKTKHRFKGSSGQFFKYSYKDIHYIVDKDGKEVTSYATPISLSPVPISFAMQQANTAARELKSNEATSNTVLVVDTSGSMRAADVWGARNRLRAVWLSIALDFLAQRIEAGEALPSDLVSIVQMGDEPTTLLCNEPCDWLLYNRVVGYLENNAISPRGHGNYCPSLDMANCLLSSSLANSSACAVSLVLLTDGRPSDRITHKRTTSDIEATVQNIAEKFGRRLSFSAVGMGDAVQFDLLQRLVDICRDFGCQAELQKPSLAAASIGSAFSSAASSLMGTKLEMKNRRIRPIRKESQTKAASVTMFVGPEEFSIYPVASVRRLIYRVSFDERGKRRKHFAEAPFLSRDASFVAISKKPFGEGAERFVYRFFELGADGKTVVGDQLVAKETRHILAESHERDCLKQGKFIRTFCAAQQISRGLAQKFNALLDRTPKVHATCPRVSFLDCSVYEIESDDGETTRSVLVETKLEHQKWYKWNANNGYVANQNQVSRRVGFAPLAPIIEEAENDTEAVAFQSVRYSAAEVAQAFSHFTYVVTGRKRLVCDLQGVASDRMIRLSDPVIHYHDQGCPTRRQVHGQTDRGRKGISLFFRSHECGSLCQIVTKGFQTDDAFAHSLGGKRSSTDAENCSVARKRHRENAS